jgi:hypothetical protein
MQNTKDMNQILKHLSKTLGGGIKKEAGCIGCEVEKTAGWIEEQEAITKAIAQFPETFELRAFPGKTFRMSRDASYVSDGRIMLYTQVLRDGEWLDAVKGTVEEMERDVIMPFNDDDYAKDKPAEEKMCPTCDRLGSPLTYGFCDECFEAEQYMPLDIDDDNELWQPGANEKRKKWKKVKALQVLHGLAKIASDLEATNPQAAELVDATLEKLVKALDQNQ